MRFFGFGQLNKKREEQLNFIFIQYYGLWYFSTDELSALGRMSCNSFNIQPKMRLPFRHPAQYKSLKLFQTNDGELSQFLLPRSSIAHFRRLQWMTWQSFQIIQTEISDYTYPQIQMFQYFATTFQSFWTWNLILIFLTLRRFRNYWCL